MFLELYRDRVFGAIRGLDRVRFRGTLRWLANERGMLTFMSHAGVLLKDFAGWAQEKTRSVRASCAAQARGVGIDTIYLRSSAVVKEDHARRVAENRGIREGPICMFSVVEPCLAPTVEGDRATQRLVLRVRERKCVHIYHYFDDPEVGFGHVRLQSWLPFSVTLCLNGRHWLEKQLRREGMAYLKDGNCFPWIEDVHKAQALLDAQLCTEWPRLLDRLLLDACPELPQILQPLGFSYYWSADETEWATDVMFHSARDLDALYPTLLRHALFVSDSPSVLRFLGTGKLTRSGHPAGHWPREIVTDLRRRREGVRIKFAVNGNSTKMYNKAGSVLRFETTINNTRDFKVFRSPDDDARRPPSWQRLRKGVSDLHRRCQVSDQSNERAARAIASAQTSQTLLQITSRACNPVVKDGKRYRALNPWSSHDLQLLTFLARGECGLNGFRNKDLRACCYPLADPSDPIQRRRLSAKATRDIRLLRAHGLVRKLTGVNRYVLTDTGQRFATALLSASHANIQTLMEMAA